MGEDEQTIEETGAAVDSIKRASETQVPYLSANEGSPERADL